VLFRSSALLELGAGFHQDLTGAENVYLNASILGLSKKLVTERFDQIVEFAGLQDFIDTPVRNYSSGMYARLGFSVAVNVDPDVLLVDEVLAVGDEFFQKKCFDKMAEFKAAGKTIILVSHSLEQIENLCERSIFLHQGEVRSTGNTDKVLSDYLDYVKSKERAALAQDEGLAGGKRWGSGEVIIESARLLNAEGEESYLFETGDKVEVEITYDVKKGVKKPVFGVAIFRNDGVYCYGINTKLDGFDIPELKKPGKISLVYDSMSLLNGSYRLSVAVFDSSAEHAYDFHERMSSFRVESKREDHGLVYFPHQWRLVDGGK
jgi:ABC-2 type transport system ATP-binding protein